MKKTDHLIKKRELHVTLIMVFFFIIYRVFVVGDIHSQRSLPIEVDDAYVYISKAHMFYNDYDRDKESVSSIRSIAKLTFENDHSDDIQNVSRYNHYAVWKGYYAYSAAFGFFTEILEADPIKVWWSFAYITQILLAISIALMINLYIGTNRIPLIISSVLCTFISIEIVHQITATPLTIANAILLIGWYFVNKSAESKILWLIGGILIALSLHIHPGAFIVLGLLSFSSLIFWYLDFSNQKQHLKLFVFASLIVFFSLLIESISVYVFNGDRYLSVIGYKTLASIRHDMTPLELLSYNFFETRARLRDFAELYSVKSLGMLLYFSSLYITYKLNKRIFVLNVVFLIGSIVGLLHYLPYHRGELIEYIGQPQLIFMAMAFAYLYIEIFQLLKNKYKRVSSIILLIILSLFAIDKYQSTVSQIESRSSRHNFSNEVSKIKEFVESLPKETSVIIGDEFTYIMMLSEVSDKYIMLADHMRKGGKLWSVPDGIPSPSGYIGKPLKEVSVAGRKYKLTNYSNANRIVFSMIDH